jgi:diguanylate cyclase (GGDEF)-like protein
MKSLGTCLSMLMQCRRVFWLVALAAAIAAAATASPQEVPLPDHPRFAFQSVSEGLGLSTATVTSLVQDRDGFLWIGTQTGLFRYDGLTVTRFGEEQWLRSSYITQLLISPRGELWVATHLGIWRYSGGKFTELSIAPTAKVSRSGRQVLAVDRDNQAFVATDKGVLRVNADNPPDTELMATSGPVSAICRASDDSVIAAWEENVGKIERRGHSIQSLPEKIDDEMYALLVDANNTIWARSEKHFRHWDGPAQHWVLEDAKLPGANDFGYPTMDSGGEILLPTAEGLYRRRNGKWEPTTLRQGMASNAVSAAIEDRDGAIWVGYVGAGIDRWPGRKEWVGWSITEGLPDSVVWAVTRDNRKRVWVGTNNGLSMWDPQTPQWRIWRDGDGLAVGAIYKLVVAGDESLWAVSTSGGLTRIDLKTLKLESIKLPSPSSTGFLGLAEAPDGSLWASGRGFIGRFGAAPHYQEFTPVEIPKDAVYATALLSFGKDGTLWAAGHTGVMRYDGKNWKHVGQEDGLRMKAIGSMWAANKNEAWVTYMEAKGATRIRLDDAGRVSVTQYGTSSGLPSNYLSLVTGDHEGNIWLGGAHGVSVIHADGKITNYDRDSGLLWNDVNAGGFYEDADGGVFIGTSRGLSYRQANAKTPERRIPDTILTSASFAGKESLREEKPRVEHKNGTFEAQFAAPAFENAADLRCRYQLQGLDRDRVETKLREVRYTALPAGNFTFQVSCGSLANGWGSPARYSFIVLSPWWQRWWSVSIGVLLAMFILRWVIAFRTRSLQKDRERLEAAVAERNAELAAANLRLEEMSLTDPLTGVQNRRFFDLTVPRQAQQTLRAYSTAGPGHPPQDRDLILFFVDLDHFKKINDKYGHAVGDQVLVEVARRLNGVVRQVDAMVRWGGEEFVIVSEGTSRDSGQHLAKRILDAIAAKSFDLAEGGALQVTCSVGWAPFPWLTTSPEEFALDKIIVFADRGLYLAKSEGRNCAVGVLPPQEEKRSAASTVEATDVRFVRDTGPAVDGGTVSVDQESVIR